MPLWLGVVVLWGAVLLLIYGALRGPGFVRRFKRGLEAALVACLACALTAVLAFLHIFQAFAGETLVADVRIRPLSQERFELTYQPTGAQDTDARSFELQGDQWIVTGGIVKWHPIFTSFGWKSYHRPMRIGGQYADVARQNTAPPSVHALSPRTDEFWEALYRIQGRLPFVEAVYGSGAYAYAEAGVRYQIYVTPSGYLIKSH